MPLSSKQRDDLNKAVLEFLRDNGYENSYQIFMEEASVDPEEAAKTATGILEKKWISVAKLMLQVKDQQKQIEELSSSLNPVLSTGGGGTVSGLPRAPAKYILSGHRKNVTKVAFHPTYSLIATASQDASIRLWDSDSGESEHTLKGHTGTVNYVAFSNTAALLASSSSDLSIKIWDIQKFQAIKTLTGHEHDVSCVEFTPNGEHLISSSRDFTIKVWVVDTGYCVKTITGHEEWVRKIAINPSGTLIASASKDQSIMIWTLDLKNKEPLIQAMYDAHDHVVEGLAWSNKESSKVIMESQYYKNAGYEIMQVGSDEEETNGEKPVVNGEMKEDEEASKTTGSVKVSKYAEKKKQLELLKKKAKEKIASKLGKDKDEEQIATGDSEKKGPQIGQLREFLVSAGRDKIIKVWDVKDGRCLVQLVGHDNWIGEVIFHPNNKFIISASDDKSIRVWDLSSGRCVKKLLEAHSNFVSTIAVNSKVLVSGSVDYNVKVWSLKQ